MIVAEVITDEGAGDADENTGYDAAGGAFK